MAGSNWTFWILIVLGCLLTGPGRQCIAGEVGEPVDEAAPDAGETIPPPEAVGAASPGAPTQTDDIAVTATSDQGLAAAEALLLKGRISRAYAIYSMLAGEQSDEPDGVARKAAGALEEIIAEGKRQVKDALALDDPTAAYIKLSELTLAYEATPVEQNIRDALNVTTFRLAKRKLKDGKGGEQTEDEKAAKALLIIGDIHSQNGRDDEARKAYETIVSEYPATASAAQANARLTVAEELHEKQRRADTHDNDAAGEDL